MNRTKKEAQMTDADIARKRREFELRFAFTGITDSIKDAQATLQRTIGELDGLNDTVLNARELDAEGNVIGTKLLNLVMADHIASKVMDILGSTTSTLAIKLSGITPSKLQTIFAEPVEGN